MGQFLDKLDNFLFDIIGLVFPGFVFLSIVSLPIYFIDAEEHLKNEFVNIFFHLKEKLHSLLKLKYSYIFVLIISYILGHVVKVFSIMFYDFMKIIFDQGIVKIFKWFWKILTIRLSKFEERIGLSSLVNSKTHSFQPFFNFLDGFNTALIKNLERLFLFRSPSYFAANEPIKEECLKYLRKEGSFPDNWYSIYKYSVILGQQNKVKSLTENYLSKYNLYRSLSVIFLFNLIYFIFLNNVFENTNDLQIIKVNLKYIVIANMLLWFTFHSKFKRYWQLCGNEALMSLYFYIKHKDTDEKK